MSPSSNSAEIGTSGATYTLPSGYSFVSEKDEGFADFKAYGDSLVLAVKKDSDPGVAMAISLCKNYTGGQNLFISDFSDAIMASYEAEGVDTISDSGYITIGGVQYGMYDIYINGDSKIVYRSVCIGENELYHVLAIGASLDDVKDIFSGFN